MLVSWDPLSLEVARGRIQNYTVHYQPTVGASGQSMTVMVPSSDSSVLISGLDPSAMYSVTVSASTGGGVGIDSDTTEVQCEYRIIMPSSEINVLIFHLQCHTCPSAVPVACPSVSTTTAVVGAVMAGVLLIVIGLSAAIIIWLVLRQRHHTSFSPQKDQR